MTRRAILFTTLIFVAVFGIGATLILDHRYDVAREILGKDFVPPEKIAERGIPYTIRQRLAFNLTLPSYEVLRWCRTNDYLVVAGPNRPLSLLEVEGSFSAYFYDISRVPPGGWVHETWFHSPEEKFAQDEKVGTVWLLVRKTPVPGSANLTWQEQVKLLSSAEYVPTAVNVSWAVMAYKLTRGENLFKKVFVRTASRSADGLHVNVGYFDQYGFAVNNDYDDRTEPYYGIAAARKSR